MGAAAALAFTREKIWCLRRSGSGDDQRRIDRAQPPHVARARTEPQHDHEIEGTRPSRYYSGRYFDTKLKHLAEWNEKRRKLASNYSRLLDGAPEMVLPYEPEWSKAVYHLYVVRVAGREALQAELAASGIGTGIHYPIPLHLQKAYRRLGYSLGDFPVSERVAPEILSLPMFRN